MGVNPIDTTLAFGTTAQLRNIFEMNFMRSPVADALGAGVSLKLRF